MFFRLHVVGAEALRFDDHPVKRFLIFGVVCCVYFTQSVSF